MNCPVCGNELKVVHEHEIDGETIPIYACEQCDLRYAKKEDIEEMAEEIRAKTERILHDKDIKTI